MITTYASTAYDASEPSAKRSTFHEAVRFLLQKHHRAFIAGMHSSMGGVDLTADRERQHAEQMLDAAIEDFEHLITVTIDRRISAAAAATAARDAGGEGRLPHGAHNATDVGSTPTPAITVGIGTSPASPCGSYYPGSYYAGGAL